MPEILTPHPGLWVHRYDHPERGWRLSVATHAAPGSGKLSLGGFRIVPKSLAQEPGFDNDRQAIQLANGMERKIEWSRLVGVGGPLARRDTSRLVGGKCVLLPSDDSRVGQPRDMDMLDFAAECMRDIEARHGFHIVTGQDLGHGILSDGKTQSLEYLHRRFPGSVISDTSKPTAEGNFYVLCGLLKAFDISLDRARVLLIGCGNIGGHVLGRLLESGSTVAAAVEFNPAKREKIAASGVVALPPERKAEALALDVDAVVVNANKHSLDFGAVDSIVSNPAVRVICGSENEAMPNPGDADRLREAGKIYCPTEFGGMMGYLTAVEEYYHQLEGTTFVVSVMMDAARMLLPASEEIGRRISSSFILPFSDAATGLRS
jgi:hypothetical protein